MREQSHKDEMSAALRGDFQRLRERGVAVELAPQEPGSEPEAPPEPEEIELAEPTEHDDPQDSTPVTEPEPTSERRGWLSRLAGR